MYSSTTDPVTHMTTLERSRETCMYRLVRYVECFIVVFFPWVLLLEQEPKTMEGWDEDDFEF